VGWGDRKVGVQMWGKIDGEGRGLHEFTWALSASSDVTSGGPNGVDTHARVTYDPLAWMSIGANAAYKHVQDPLADENACRDDWRRDPGCRRDVFAAGGDLRFLVGKKLYASVEVNLAQNWRFADTSPWGVGALAYASYDIEVGKRTTLQPVAFAEYIDTNLTFKQSEAVRAVFGFNVLWTKHLRVMPQVQLVDPLPPITGFNPAVKRRVYGLWISVNL
ncbi:MAG: hypothetical protein KC431_10675, partial [Myxococcales bacterium]|nr:hypothetical protein [Myxococcales bacterium]